MKPNRHYTGLKRTPQSLGWLLKERGKARGALDRRKKLHAQLMLEMHELQDRLDSIDRVIPLHEIKVEPKIIEGKRGHTTSIYKGCRLKAKILARLKEAAGLTLTTTEVVNDMVAQCRIDPSKYKPRQLREPVRCLLKTMASQGKLTRHHPRKCDGFQEGRWSLPLSDD